MIRIQPKAVFAAALVALTLAAATPAVAQGLWLHVKVDNSGSSEKVTVNLPLSLIEKALPMIPQDAIESSRIVLEKQEIDINDLRALWAEVQSHPDFTLVNVEGTDENVQVKKAGEYLRVEVREGEEGNVDVRIPTRVVEALLSGEGDQLNLVAALEALAAHGQGELVTVNEDNEKVRIWIDDIAEAR